MRSLRGEVPSVRAGVAYRASLRNSHPVPPRRCSRKGEGKHCSEPFKTEDSPRIDRTKAKRTNSDQKREYGTKGRQSRERSRGALAKLSRSVIGKVFKHRQWAAEKRRSILTRAKGNGAPVSGVGSIQMQANDTEEQVTCRFLCPALPLMAVEASA